MPEREPDFRIERLEGKVGELVLDADRVTYRSPGGTASHSGDMTDRESRAFVRGILLADRKRSGPGWGATIMIAILAVPAVMVALGFLVAWKDDRLGEVLSLEPAAYYESVDRTTCKDIVAIGGTCRSPLPRR